MVERSTRQYGKPPFGIDAVPVGGELLPVTEEVVAATAFGSLIRFKREGAEKCPKVMLVAPLSGHHATLLRGTVAALLPAHDVHITDGKLHGKSIRFTLWHPQHLCPAIHFSGEVNGNTMRGTCQSDSGSTFAWCAAEVQPPRR